MLILVNVSKVIGSSDFELEFGRNSPLPRSAVVGSKAQCVSMNKVLNPRVLRSPTFGVYSILGEEPLKGLN